MSTDPGPPLALVTGVGRARGIGAHVARALALDGWDVAAASWRPYDERMPWGADHAGADEELLGQLASLGARAQQFEVDLAALDAAERLFAEVVGALGPVSALVLSHCESVDSGVLDTSIESFDRHVAVNARASWLLIRELGRDYQGLPGRGRIVALTSDAVVGNMAYGASKGMLDRIVVAAAGELGHLGITANLVNPGPNDTGWMSDALAAEVVASTPLGRLGRPTDTAELVRFLLSAQGGWITGQLLHSDGGQSI